MFESEGRTCCSISVLASLYGVETEALIRAVKRNRSRFPADFLLDLTAQDGELEVPIWYLNLGRRAFVQLRRVLDSNAELARKLDALEKKYHGQFRVVFEAIRQLMQPPEQPRKTIGFRKPEN